MTEGRGVGRGGYLVARREEAVDGREGSPALRKSPPVKQHKKGLCERVYINNIEQGESPITFRSQGLGERIEGIYKQLRIRGVTYRV